MLGAKTITLNQTIAFIQGKPRPKTGKVSHGHRETSSLLNSEPSAIS